jgi:hypothetical protein
MKEKLILEIQKEAGETSPQVGVSVAIDTFNREGSPVSGSVSLIPRCSSHEMLEREVSRIKERLDALLEESQKLFESEPRREPLEVDENLSAEEIWNILLSIEDFELLSKEFNNLSHEKRLEVADHVFTNCNIFSGVASVFSMRYNSEQAQLE